MRNLIKYLGFLLCFVSTAHAGCPWITWDADSNILRMKLIKKSTGQGFTTLTSSSTGLLISTACENEATPTYYDQASSKIESITTLGTFATPTATKARFKEFDATHNPGIYEVQLDNARYSVTSCKNLLISINGVSDLSEADCNVQLTKPDLQGVPNVNFHTATNNALTASAIQDGAFTEAKFPARNTLQSATTSGGGGGVLASIENFGDNALAKNTAIHIVSSTLGAGQTKCICGNTNSTDAFTLCEPWDILPTGTITYNLIPDAKCDGTISTDGLSAASLKTDAVTEIVDAIFAHIYESQGNITFDQFLRLGGAVLFGRSTGGGLTFKTPNNGATRVTVTVDGSDNRTAVTLNP